MTPSLRSLRGRWTDLLAAYWFVTLATAAAGPLLFVITLVIDKANGPAGLLEGFVISPDAARTILGSIAGSLITIASLTSSLTIVTLQLLSNQYTPRAVRGFLRRKISQIVSGAFIGIFTFCLLLLVVVRSPGDDNEPFVPSLGIIVGIVLALVGLVLLVVFIQRLSSTIQVSTMTADIAQETARAIDCVHPHAYSVTAEDELPPPLTGPTLRAGRAGYVRRIDVELRLPPRQEPASVELLVRPGEFVTDRTPVARGQSAATAEDGAGQAILAAVVVGHERDIDEDPGFGIRQLVDIALRALSPGINDPTTAVTCIGYLRNLIELLAGRSLPAVVRTTSGGVSLIAHQWGYEAYLEPLTEIARYATTDARVTAALLDALCGAADACRSAGAHERREQVETMLRDLATTALDHAETDADRARLRALLTGLS